MSCAKYRPLQISQPSVPRAPSLPVYILLYLISSSIPLSSPICTFAAMTSHHIVSRKLQVSSQALPYFHTSFMPRLASPTTAPFSFRDSCIDYSDEEHRHPQLSLSLSNQPISSSHANPCSMHGGGVAFHSAV